MVGRIQEPVLRKAGFRMLASPGSSITPYNQGQLLIFDLCPLLLQLSTGYEMRAGGREGERQERGKGGRQRGRGGGGGRNGNGAQ